MRVVVSGAFFGDDYGRPGLGLSQGDLLGEKETAPASFIEQTPWRWF